MTLDDFIAYKKITPDNINEKIKDLSRTYSGGCGGDIDYACSPKGVELNGVKAFRNPEIKAEFYTWNEVYQQVCYAQIKFFKEAKMAYICNKPSCNGCKHYRYDEEKETKCCFAKADAKTGYWIADPHRICEDECSCCGLPPDRKAGEPLPAICPNCGAEMEVKQ